MILLSKNTTNKLYIQCDDILTEATPYYYFRFTNRLSKKQDIIELVNEQPTNQRFDLFTLILPTDLDLKDGVYSWEVYESETTGLSSITGLNMLSNGSARVGAIFTANDEYEPEGTDTVYEG
jgi:hypothetical protein